MIAFPNAKINLGLNIIGRRADGYHNLETVFYPIPLEDALEVTTLHDAAADKDYEFHLHGTHLDCTADENLVIKAYRLLGSHFSLPPVDIHLLKRIPSSAGLGGGSSDAAFMLKMLNECFSLGLSDSRLEELASSLGADCPFFIKNLPVYAEGTGNIFSPLQDFSLAGYNLWLVKPDIFVSTREAFAKVTPRKPDVRLKDIVRLPLSEWRGLMHNDFEESVFAQYPSIALIKEEMYARGAMYASMSGSGSSVYGIFTSDTELPDVDFGKGTFTYKAVLR